jgi:O-antigen/teichoic acid export membrane protein
MKRKKIFNRYVTNLLLTTVFGGVIGLINYLFNIFIARFSTENIFGLYSSAIGLIYLIQIPALTIQNVLIKSVGKTKKGDIRKLKITSLISFGLIGLFLSVFLYSSSSFFTDNMEETVKLVFPLSITFLLAFLSPISKGILLGKEKIVLVNIILLVETFLKFGIGYLAIRMGGNIGVLILANALPAFLSFLVVLPFLKSPKSYKKKIDIPYKEILLMTISLLLLSAPYTLDLILIPFGLKAEYGALSLVGKLVYFAGITVASVMFARLSNQRGKRKDLRTLGITVTLTFLIGAVASVVLFIFKDFVVELAFGGKYSGISIYFVVFGLIMTAYAIVYIIANFFFARDSYWYILILVFVTVLQVVLLRFRVTDLFSVVCNQVIVYSLLLILTFIYFIFNFLIKSYVKRIKKDV